MKKASIKLYLLLIIITCQLFPKSLQAQNNLKVICYNTHLFGGTIAGIGKTLFVDNKRIESIAKKLMETDADIIGLSEVWATHNKMKLRDLLSDKYPFSFIPKGLDKKCFGPSSGLVIFSKYKIDNKNFTAFKDLCYADDMSKKGFLSCTIALPDGDSAHLIMTHLQADYANNGRCQTDLARASNFAQINEHIKKLPSKAMVLCMGDFNVIGEMLPKCDEQVGQFTDEYKQVVDRFKTTNLIDAFRVKNTADLGYTYSKKNCLIKRFYPKEKESQWRLDYLFFRGHGKLKLKEAKVFKNFQFSKIEKKAIKRLRPCDCEELSDHYPIFFEFSYKN